MLASFPKMTRSRDLVEYEPLLDQPGGASEAQPHREREVNGKPTSNGDWKCNTKFCGLADTSSVAAKEERSEATKKLSRAVCFCVVFMVVEIVGGIKAGSLAVLTDAVHLSSDVASFAISLFAVWAGGWEADDRHTFGFYRAEVLGALISILIIWLVTGSIVYEAIHRLFSQQAPIDGRLMFIVASLGLLVNLVMMVLLGHGHGHGGHDHGHGHSHGDEHGDEHSHDHAEQRHHHDEESSYLSSQAHIAPMAGTDTTSSEQDSSNPKHREDHSHDHADHQHHHDEESPYVPPQEHRSIRVDKKSSDPRQHGQECKRLNLEVKESDKITYCICEVESPFERKLIIDSTSNEHEVKPSRSSKGRENVNVKSAYLHVLGDLVQSIGVMIGGAVIWWKPDWMMVDLICTFVFSVAVLLTTLKMVSDVLAVLMESTPREIDAKALEKGLLDISGVSAVHELHIWAITVGKVILACHVTIQPDAQSEEVLQKVVHYCDSKFKISHVTIQIEREKEDAPKPHTPEGHSHEHHHDHLH